MNTCRRTFMSLKMCLKMPTCKLFTQYLQMNKNIFFDKTPTILKIGVMSDSMMESNVLTYHRNGQNLYGLK